MLIGLHDPRAEMQGERSAVPIDARLLDDSQLLERCQPPLDRRDGTDLKVVQLLQRQRLLGLLVKADLPHDVEILDRANEGQLPPFKVANRSQRVEDSVQSLSTAHHFDADIFAQR